MARTAKHRAEGARQRLVAGLPVTERRVEPAGVSTAVLEAGDGPPLVLLHGGIQCGGVYWAPVISRLAERHRVVVPDLPGLANPTRSTASTPRASPTGLPACSGSRAGTSRR